MKHFVSAIKKIKKRRKSRVIFSRNRKHFANGKIPPNKTADVKSRNAPTLRGAVVFVSVNPGEPDALLGLVREDQLGRRVGSLCEHNQRQLTTNNAPTNIFFFCFISLNKKNR